MKNSELKTLLQSELIAAGFDTTKIVDIQEVESNTIIKLNGDISMSRPADRQLINWLDTRFVNGVRPDEHEPSKIIINTPIENTKDLYVKNTKPAFCNTFKSVGAEKKPNITLTPWEIRSSEIRSGVKQICDPYEGRNYDGNKYLPIDEREANAQAIVTAVNCTYGANINPEKIQELIERLALIASKCSGFGMTKQEKLDQIEAIAIKALKNIKYKD